MSRSQKLGRSGEDASLEFLRKKNYEILHRGFRFHRAEIDIIARDGETLVFIEVKTRRRWEHGLPEESVTPAKQRQIRRVAEAYLALNSLPDVPCRFDILSLYFRETRGYEVHHILDAFQ
jgi:putative endonuclease